MSNRDCRPLLVGEVFVDFTLTGPGAENKLRLGGIAHAARGFWAAGVQFSVAAIIPTYLESVARKYFSSLDCEDFRVIGHVDGAPNVIKIADPKEVSEQGYEILLRDEKSINLLPVDLSKHSVSDVLLFPGGYDLAAVSAVLPPDVPVHIDIAYDVTGFSELTRLRQPIGTLFLSTSSDLFRAVTDQGLAGLQRAVEPYIGGGVLILKENRGGARLAPPSGDIVALPAQLGSTVNSVGVGDVFAAAYLSSLGSGYAEAGWRATYAAAAYSQTTYPDLFKKYVERNSKLNLTEMQGLGGTFLPWEQRRSLPIYLAAPDFSYGSRVAIDQAIAALEYHNFSVRRPVVENGELPADATALMYEQTYQADCALLGQCVLLFAVPTGRDPGTLVEVGMAIERGMPVVVYDPSQENRNTMLIAGATHFSSDLDSCLNAVFVTLAKVKRDE